MRIAIVGAGISGLAAAHLLAREHEIAVFEADGRPGGHASTVRVDTEHGTHHVDTGFIVFNERNYPNFQRLLASLRVPSQPSDMSVGVSDGRDFEYDGASANGLFAKATLSVHVESRRGGRPAFDATLGLRRQPLARRPLLGASLRTLALIYAHALVLKAKGVRVHPHPEVT